MPTIESRPRISRLGTENGKCGDSNLLVMLNGFSPSMLPSTISFASLVTGCERAITDSCDHDPSSSGGR